MLRCEECGVEADVAAADWLVLSVRDVENVHPPFDVEYCPACAEREFGTRDDMAGTSARGSVRVRRRR